MATAQEIKSQAEKRLKEIEAAIKKAEDSVSGLREEHKTLTAMVGAAPASRTRRSASSRRRTATSRRNGSAPARKRTSKRAPRGQRQQQLLDAAKKSPQARPADLAKTLGVSDSQVHALINKSKKEKKLSRPGGKWKVAAG